MGVKHHAVMGFWMCVALVVGNTIGAGIFLLPASLAPYGLNSLTAWGLTGSGALLLAVVFARLSRAHPTAGGPYAYVQLAFGPFTAFIAAWGYWVSIWVGNAAIATGAVRYLAALMPWIDHFPGASVTLTLSLLWLFTLVNWYGVKASAWVQSATTVLKLLPLLCIALLGAISWPKHGVSLTAAIPLSWSGTTSAATLTLYALLGLESATIPADKVRNASRTIPMATLVGTLLTVVICIVVCTTVQFLVPPDTLSKSDAPLVDLANIFWGHTAGKALAVFAAIGGLGALNGWILLQGEIPSAMAKNGVFPGIFSRESPRGTPSFSLLFSSSMVTLLILLNCQKTTVNAFTFMVLLSTTACLVLYALCSLALLRLQWTGQIVNSRRGAVALAIVGVLASLYSLWAVAGAGVEAVIWGAVLLALGAPLYMVVRRTKTPWIDVNPAAPHAVNPPPSAHPNRTVDR